VIAQDGLPAVSQSGFATNLSWVMFCCGGIAVAHLLPMGVEILCVVLAVLILVAPPGIALGCLAVAAWIKVRNPYLFQEFQPNVVAGWLPLVASMVRAALQPSAVLQSRGALWVAAFAVIAGGALMATPTNLSVSIPKLLVLSGGLIAMLVLVADANRPAAGSVGLSGHDIVMGIFIATTCLSAPLLAIPGIGFLRNTTGFQGVTGQPQAFAVLYAPLVAYLLVRVVETRSLAALHWLGLIAGSILLVWSQSRTGVAACLAGICLGLFVWWRGRVKTAPSGAWLKVSAVVIVLAIAGYLHREEIREAVSGYLLKGVAGDFDAETLLTSRAVLFLTGWQNFVAHPVFGIGFGVSTTPELLEVATSDTFGVTLSASMEKGSGFLQILEETGLVGAAVLAFFIGTVCRATGVTRSASAMALVGAALATNLGEAIIYSLGGVGLAQWAYVMLGMTLLQASRSSAGTQP
jgi:hypothetical protein